MRLRRRLAPGNRCIGSFSRVREKAGDEGALRSSHPHPNPLPPRGRDPCDCAAGLRPGTGVLAPSPACGRGGG